MFNFGGRVFQTGAVGAKDPTWPEFSEKFEICVDVPSLSSSSFFSSSSFLPLRRNGCSRFPLQRSKFKSSFLSVECRDTDGADAYCIGTLEIDYYTLATGPVRHSHFLAEKAKGPFHLLFSLALALSQLSLPILIFEF